MKTLKPKTRIKAGNALIRAIIYTESRGNPMAVSRAGAKGLMQLMDKTGKEWHKNLEIVEPYDPFDPEQNVRIGTAYINWLLDAFEGDNELALAAYNFGIGNIRKALKQQKAKTFDEIKAFIPKETKRYVPVVLDRQTIELAISSKGV